jgi:hypothetical protein
LAGAPLSVTAGAGNITADGRYVVFFSTGNTISPDDTDRFFDVFGERIYLPDLVASL